MTIIDRVREYMLKSTGEVRVSHLGEVVEGSMPAIYTSVARLLDSGEIIRIRNGVIRSKATYDKLPPDTPASSDELGGGTPAPVTKARAPEPAPEPVESETAASPTFHAMLHIDGDLDVHGLVELADGGYRIGAADVERLRSLIGAPGVRTVVAA